MEGNSLRFLGRYKLAKKLDGSNTRHYVIPTKGFKNIEHHIRGISIQENIQQQKNAVTDKVIKRQVKRAKIISENLKKKFIKTIRVWAILDKYSACNLIHPINKEYTLSRKGMAKVFGLKTANSGSYWAKKLTMLEDKPQGWFSLGVMNKDYFYALQLKSKRHLFYKDGEGYVRLPNLIKYEHQRSM